MRADDPREVTIDVGGPSGDPVRLRGVLTVPPEAVGVVLFAHGSGSSRLSPRNAQVARSLNEARLATLLFDLLTDDEALDRRNVFDVGMLGERLLAATRWLRATLPAALPVTYFGASTGAAAALWAAAEPENEVAAVVSRGGRPDLAAPRLPDVRAPTLLIVGSLDETVVDLNREAQQHLRATSELVVVPGASHLFEEAGAMERVSEVAALWLTRHCAAREENE